MADNEKLFSVKDVLDIVSKTTAIAAQDLVEATEGKELTDSKALLDVINPIAVLHRNELITKEFNKAKSKVSRKVEKKLAELFPDDDFEGKDVDSLLEVLPTKIKPAKESNSSNKLTTEQAMQHPEVRDLIAKLKQDSENYKKLTSEFESYKSNQKVIQKAVAELEREGATFSSDPVIKARQIKAFEAELTRFKYKEDANGNLIPLDDEGEHPRYNTGEGKEWDFKSFVKTLSPVDFKSEQTTQNTTKDKNIPIPNGSGTVQNFGFTNESIKQLSSKDYETALRSGETAKAEFIKKSIIERAEKAQ